MPRTPQCRVTGRSRGVTSHQPTTRSPVSATKWGWRLAMLPRMNTRVTLDGWRFQKDQVLALAGHHIEAAWQPAMCSSRTSAIVTDMDGPAA